jgi:Xaa-Pro aminopeptidase
MFFLCIINTYAQQSLFQSDFEWAEFKDRRNKILDSIGPNSIALIQGALSVTSFEVFRQTNELYYLTGLEIPHAYLLLNGRNKSASLYLPHRDERRERGEGKTLSAEDSHLLIETTEIDDVQPLEALSTALSRLSIHYPVPVVYTPHSPGEGKAGSRDELVNGLARISNDPWANAHSKEVDLIQNLKLRFSQFEVRDLSPMLDEMRLIKSPREIDLIRKASEIAGVGLMEAIKSTQPNLLEYQLAAISRFYYLMNGAKYEGYSAIVGGGKNAWHGHYFHNKDTLKSGELVLMDYAPDYHYYTSDVTRIWPVNGKFTQGQRELYGVIVSFYKELSKRIRPGVSAQQITDETSMALRPIIEKMSFSKPIYRKAAEGALTFKGALSHPVGMAVHDVGNYKKGLLEPGMVFSIDPMIWVPEEKLYIRIEDVGVVTDSGFENFSSFVPFEIDEIEKLMKKDGIIEEIVFQKVK